MLCEKAQGLCFRRVCKGNRGRFFCGILAEQNFRGFAPCAKGGEHGSPVPPKAELPTAQIEDLRRGTVPAQFNRSNAPALLPEGQAPAAPGWKPKVSPGLVAPAVYGSGATAIDKYTALTKGSAIEVTGVRRPLVYVKPKRDLGKPCA